jgi:chemotaxis protein MotA
MVDIATIIGLIGAFALLAYGILSAQGADLAMFWDLPSLLITGGGTFSAIMTQFTLAELKNLGSVLRHAFFYRPKSALKVIADFRKFADIARRDGILALENVTADIDDPFLVKGIQLAVDGTDPDVIQTMMTTELEQMTARHDKGIEILKKIAEYAPAFGMLGTLIGLVIMLRNLNDLDTLGPAMGVAIITTLYGGLLAFAAVGPLSVKLERRSNEELLLREMMIRGVMSLQSGDNPRIVEQKLKIFLPPALRGKEGAS